MSSHIAIAGSLRSAAATGEAVVLATVVRVIGSSYGGVGSRMVIRVDGTTVGLVSGGCLESDLCAHAVEVHSTGIARVVTYDTRADDDAVWGLGLGCNGLIDVLLQPLLPEQALAAAALLEAALTADAPSAIATVTHSDPAEDAPSVGAQVSFAGGTMLATGDWGDGAALRAASAHASAALAAGRRGLVVQLGPAQVAFETVSPAIRLLVCGSGPDAAPLCRIARDLGWDVTVMDHRPITEAQAARFPGVRLVECADAAAIGVVAKLTPRTAAVVMSHHFARDTDYVAGLLRVGVGYIGVLGPRARTERMLAELASRGEPGASCGPDSLFGPVGLDLGGEGPEAIALAIAAEVSAVMNARRAGHLSEQEKPVFDTGG